MGIQQFFDNYYKDLELKIKSVDYTNLQQAVQMVLKTQKSGGKIILVGNGGSAAMASHVAVDFTKTAGVRAINFNEADLLTCFSNDYGYEHWVEKALEFYSDQGDLVILISSSGESQNLINGAKNAKSMGLSVITFTGFLHNNALRNFGDLNFWADSCTYNIVEMTHHVWLVSIIDFIIETWKIAK